ncbi:hypothetical protein [Tunturiibacter lichenicola]|uniref:hypothetical protein n=1 Tax=Tunturiibacter lichenicola TaxID=2051959 RepID=UPI0021B2DB8D|nr:hypothetical protein [Edaphobacter lichenicola]
MNIEQLKRLSLKSVNEPMVEYTLEVDVEIVEAMNDLIAELNAEGYPVTLDHVVDQALTEWCESDGPRKLVEKMRRSEATS